MKYVNNDNIDLSNNYWCSFDSSYIHTTVFDGNDSINLGLIKLLPLDTADCYNCNYIDIAFTNNYYMCLTAIPSNGIPPYTFLWLTTPEQNTPTICDVESGCYTVCITDSMGCCRCDSILYIFSNNTIHKEDEFKIVPNPASDYIKLYNNQTDLNFFVNVYDLYSHRILSLFVKDNITSIDISALPNGAYIFEILNKNIIKRQKLIIQKNYR